ncbi:MAG: hypothetical protein WD557_05660 [Dehalococcoidia bacterium]
MVLICAWCDRTLRRGAGPVSHGICENCSRLVESRVVERWDAPPRRNRRRELAKKIPLPGFDQGLVGAPAG